MQKSLEQTDKAINAVAQLMNGVAQSLKEVLSIISAGTLVASQYSQNVCDLMLPPLMLPSFMNQINHNVDKSNLFVSYFEDNRYGCAYIKYIYMEFFHTT